MKLTWYINSRVLLSRIVSGSVFALANGAHTQDQQLPDYVIEQFGTPPALPSGPLSDDLKAAVQTAFVIALLTQAGDQIKPSP